jgi:hypothetical protein
MRLVTASAKNHSRIRPSDSASAITTVRAERLGRLAGHVVNLGVTPQCPLPSSGARFWLSDARLPIASCRDIARMPRPAISFIPPRRGRDARARGHARHPRYARDRDARGRHPRGRRHRGHDGRRCQHTPSPQRSIKLPVNGLHRRSRFPDRISGGSNPPAPTTNPSDIASYFWFFT